MPQRPDSHSGSSVCTPTRYGVLTGRYAWRTKLQSGVIGGLLAFRANDLDAAQNALGRVAEL